MRLALRSGPMTPTFDVFLCYAWAGQGKQLADTLYLALHDQGLTVFQDDKETQPTDEHELLPTVMAALLNSRILVPLMTPQFDASPHCFLELATALTQAYRLDDGSLHRVKPVLYRIRPGQVPLRQLKAPGLRTQPVRPRRDQPDQIAAPGAAVRRRRQRAVVPDRRPGHARHPGQPHQHGRQPAPPRRARRRPGHYVTAKERQAGQAAPGRARDRRGWGRGQPTTDDRGEGVRPVRARQRPLAGSSPGTGQAQRRVLRIRGRERPAGRPRAAHPRGARRPATRPAAGTGEGTAVLHRSVASPGPRR